MKKIILFIIAALLSTGLFIGPALAQDPCEGAADSSFCQNRDTSGGNPLFGPDGLATKVTQVLVVIAGLVSVIAVILGGISYITSGGDSKKTASAKNTILYASIGVIVSLLSQALVTFILSKL